MILVLLLFLIKASAEPVDIKSVHIVLGEKLSISKNVSLLQELHTAIEKEKYKDCLTLAAKAEVRFHDLKPWVALFKLQCMQAFFKNDRKAYQAAQALVDSVWMNADLLLFGAQGRKLRLELTEFTLNLFEYAHKSDRNRAWDYFDYLNEVKEWLTSAQAAKLYYYAAELHLHQQNLYAAREFYEKSLKEENNEIVRGKYRALVKKIDPDSTPEPIPSLNTSHTDVTEEELEVYKRMNEAISSGDLLAAVQDGIKIIREYPGGKRAVEAAKNVLNVYLGIALRTDKKFNSLKEQIIGEMRKADGQRLFEWAQVMVTKEKYEDAIVLSGDSIEKIGGQPLSSKVLLLAGQSAQFTADFQRARQAFDILIKMHSGSKIASEARFRLGLIDYRQEKYAEAANHFEVFLQGNEYSDFELSALYWLWRSHQKTGAKAEVEVCERLLRKYPLSYYAMRVRAEFNNNKISFPANIEKTAEWTFQFTSRESKSWERFLILFKSGFIEEAKTELSMLSEPAVAMGKLVYAYLWSEVGDYVRSSEVLARTFALDGRLVAASSLRVAYPILYQDEIKKEAAKYAYPPELVMSLIKQESSYRKEVRSPAGALGLMQLMPETAREIGTDLRVKFHDLTKDLTNPQINIRIGSQYLSRLLLKHSGHVPLALAAYNAGIGNVRNWLLAREDLAGLEKSRDSSPLSELWLDELPWPETSGYIKSVLRNYLVYRFLDQGEYILSNPVWTYAN